MKANRGQTIVELALLLPALSFSVLVIVQFLVFCRNQLEIQHMAQIASDQVAPTTPAGRAIYPQFNKLWGSHTLPDLNRTSAAISSWKPYRGVSTVTASAQLMTLDIESYLLPGPVIEALGLAKQHATAQALREAPVPGGHP